MRPSVVLTLMAVLAAAQTYSVQQPKGTWQKPGEIQQPKGPWLNPGPIQVPKGIQAIRTQDDKCQRRLIVGSDALFEFNQATLSAGALETLEALGPLLRKSGKHPVIIEGHTDGIGSLAFNQELSERRAQAVRGWLIAERYAEEGTVGIKGYGKARPIAPNTMADGSDNPAGRQKNRRVEVVIDTCK